VTEIISVIAKISAFTFIITSMLAMGLSLTVKQILDPLRNVKVVLLALLANFVLVPALAYLITVVIPLDDGLATGLIIVGTAAGAPFLPKLVQLAKGNAAFSVGLMTLLMVVTVIYLPIVLPLLLPGASVNPWDIGQSLIFSMLLPLGIGLFVKARYSDIALSLQPHMSQISSLAIVLMLVTILVLEFSTIIGTIGTGGVLAALVFVGGALGIGLLLGGKDAGMRPVMGLGTAQRNLSAAMLVAAQNFVKDPNVLIMVMLVAILGLILLGVVAGEMGKRAGAAGEAKPAKAPDDQPSSAGSDQPAAA
jgi:BASS family bile acid:Na+ symporter